MSKKIHAEQTRIKMIAGMIAVVFLFQLVSCNATEDTAPTQKKSLKDIIVSGRTPADLTSHDERSREIFSRYDRGVPLVVKYLKPGGTGDGSSFSNAAGNLKTVLGTITNAAADRVYAVFLTGGEYKAGSTMAMKNHVAIIGGVDEDLGSSETVTALDGEGKYQVFNNNGLTNTALLYGVTITNGKARDGGGMYNGRSSPSLVGVTFSGNTATGDGVSDGGGGMYNEESSPSLVGVTFSGNTAERDGGGMFNFSNSSPSLVGVTFSGNRSKNDGGGMHNFSNSSPSLVGVAFSENTATDDGGGMHNEDSSSPSLVGVTFSGNTAIENGGGMYNEDSSSPSLVGVTFSGNTATEGGGMYNDNDGGAGPLIINSIFWGNTARDGGSQFYFLNDDSGQENLRIYNSIVEEGTGTLVSGTTSTSVNQVGFGSGGLHDNPGTAPVVISFSNIIGKHPGLRPLADNGGSVLTHAITKTSPAVNQGLYVKKSGNTFYYNENGNDWYTEPDLSGEVGTVPVNVENLTATDATGYPRTGRPDLGAYEAR